MTTRKKTDDLISVASESNGRKQDTVPASTPKSRGTPIETCKGDPDAERLEEEGDIEKETLDRNAPYNKTYGIKDESKD